MLRLKSKQSLFLRFPLKKNQPREVLCVDTTAYSHEMCISLYIINDDDVERDTHLVRVSSGINAEYFDYRPYTWESAAKAKQIYNLACDYCSGIIGNDDEFAVLSGSYDEGLDYAKKLSTNCDLVIYKMGEKGSITFANNEEITKGIFPVKPLKPTGAGDAFMGSLIGALFKNYDLQRAIEISSAAAAIVVTKVGCAPAMPDLDEVLDFMKNNNINKGDT